MDPGRLLPLALTVAGAGLFAAAFPPLDIGFLAFLAPLPLLLAVRRVAPGYAALLGWVYGTLGCTADVGGSLYEASGRYFAHAPWLRAVFAVAMPQLYAAPYFALFAVAARAFLRAPGRPALAALGVPAAWVAAEYARATVGHGCPWLLLAHAQHNALPLLQVADLCGAYGVSFVVMSGVLALLGLLDVGSRASGMRPRAVAIALPAVVVATAIIYGELQLRRWVAVPGATLRVGMVQGDVPLAWRRSAAHASMALDRLRTLTRDVVAAEPDLVVWPENAVGFAVAANESLFTDVVRGLAPEARLLLGAPRAVEREPGRVEFRNTAFLLDTAGHVVAQYDKRHLTPFAEYAPWPGALFSTRRFARADVYRPGDAWTLFDVRGVRFATLICYEAIYASVARRVVRDGAALLVNISNDDWFGTRSALDQHLYAALLGAVATRRTLVRVTNTGITAVIAPTGAVVARAPAGVPSTLVAEVTAVETMSPYTRVGDAFAWLCVLGTVVGGGIAAWRPSLESPGAGLLGPGKL